MGTSTVHRSPDNYRWSMVNTLYRDPKAEPEELMTQIFRAGDSYATGLADEAVLDRLQSVLDWAGRGTWRQGTDAAMAASREAIAQARQRSVESQRTSYYADLADRAVHRTLVGATRQPDSVRSTSATMRTFLVNLIGVSVDHLVSRDLSRHLRSQRLPNAVAALELRRDLVQRARDVASDERLNTRLASAATAPNRQWAEVVADAWRLGTE